MRKAKKAEELRSRQNQEFERMYRTIPAHSRTGEDFSPEDDHIEKEQTSQDQLSKPRATWKKVVKRLCIIVIIIAALIGLWLGWKFVANTIKVFGWNGLWDIFRTQKLNGEDGGRVNILLAGNSSDDVGHAGAELTDSIMLISLNTKDKNGYILSVPRDLYVDIPGFSYAKINETYQNGQKGPFSEAGYPAGGMGLLEKTVSEHFGVPIHYYGLVNYTALQQAVDAVGGIQITIQSTDPRGLYDPSPDLKHGREPLVNLPNGTVTLDGKAALNLARARGNARGSYGYGLGDFVRTQNQRNILIGLKDKAASAETLANPLKTSQLLDSLGNNVQTDFEPSELRRLYKISKEIPSTDIASVSLNNANGENLLKSYRTRTGQSALIPAAGLDDYSAIRTFIQGL